MSGTAASTAPAMSSPTLPPASYDTSPALHSTAAGAITSFAPPMVSLPPLTVHNCNISSYIRFFLDPAQNNYHRWRTIFRSVAAKYNGLAHIDESANRDTTDPEWRRADISVLLWFHATVVDTLLDVVMPDDATALDVWTRIERYFLANRASRGIHLRRQFNNQQQGDMSIAEYTRQLKTLATAIGDCGKRLSDDDLTTQLLHGLAKPFHAIGDNIGDTVPLPDFETAVSRLSAAEEKMQQWALLEGTSALVIHGGLGDSSSSTGARSINPSGGARGVPGDSSGHGGPDSSAGSVPGGSQGSAGPGGGGQGGGGQGGGGQGTGGYGRGRGRGRGRGDSGRAPPQPAAITPWMGYFAPYGAALPRPAWVPPNAAGVLGPRTAAPTQAYPVMYSGPTPFPAAAPAPGSGSYTTLGPFAAAPYATPGSANYPTPAPFPAAPTLLPGPSSWDQQALFHQAYSNVATQHPNSATDWIMDSGASSHVTGSRQQDGSHALQ
ncbi:keratin, type I cytoskeletal 10-like isoform X2 [Triticum aestivum]|uniref:keratin, type I cytoskeletal 10-like isoform X2 n=2 Tax=Triticum aestivum TaxID=4565 RepID=UPI001D022F8D|nr:keratin, type I cytoskeletal 10-like isoform X2 [Triticum aestivum]